MRKWMPVVDRRERLDESGIRARLDRSRPQLAKADGLALVVRSSALPRILT